MYSRAVCLAVALLTAAPHLSADTTIDSTSAEKSAANAVALSLFGTIIPGAASIPFVTRDIPKSNWNEAVGVTLIGTGVLFGPGLGHIYAGNRHAFYRGLTIRGIGGGIMLLGVVSMESIFDEDEGAAFMIFLGGLSALVSMVYDIATADNSARDFNERQRQSAISVYPSMKVQPGGAQVQVRIGF